MNHAQRPRIILGNGPRACERALLETVTEAMETRAAGVLAQPVYLLVPSHSLRDHLLGRLVGLRHGWAGLGCFTLRGLALEILERAGESPPPGSWMLPILTRRLARQHASLRSTLDHLRDGYASLIGPVTDLLEAGLDPAHAEAVDEVLAEEGRLVASVAEVQRSRSLVQVAIRAREEMESLGLGHVSALLQRATELLRTDPDFDLPCSGFHVYGFADATGVATDLIEAVLLRFGGYVYLDHPPDPADPQSVDPSFEFSRRFATRLVDLGQQGIAPAVVAEPPTLRLISALGGQAEVREVGWRIRRLLDEGVIPEHIGVVARRLEPYRSPLRTHFDRLGIPFSAPRASGPLLPPGRRIRALLELLTRRGRTRIERWLDARVDDPDGIPVFDLRLALFGLGVGRLDELAQLRRADALQRDTYPLPVRLGYLTDEIEGAHLARRRIPTNVLHRAQRQAIELHDLFESWAPSRPWSDHRESLDRLLSLLGWPKTDPALSDIRTAIDRLGLGFPGSMDLQLEEITLALTHALSKVGSDRFGGQGGGVQILDVIEARGRTFAHLFLLGLNRGVFPRNVREDPAFPDHLRRVLGREGHGVLPDLPLKRAGFAEERFLFAQLCSASEQITISWQVADDDNRETTASPLVERLLWTGQAERVTSPQHATPADDLVAHPRTGVESAIRAALFGSHRQIHAALTSAQPADLTVAPQTLTVARLRIVAELDRPPGHDSRLGPYFGLVGEARDPADPRTTHDLYVTTLERFAVCPWQTLLERLLRLEPLPDPVEILPGIDPFLTGLLVHRVLERLVREQIPSNPATLDDARRAVAPEIAWPEGPRLQQVVLREAITVSHDHGIAFEGFAEVFAQMTLPYLHQALQLLAKEPTGLRPAAAEMEGSLPTGQGRQLHFKADRVDIAGESLLLTDFKTSRRGISEAKTPATREKHLLAEIAKGRLLQATAYARASAGRGDCGRYVFVHPDFKSPEESRIVAVTAENEAAGEAFEQAVTTLVHAWHSGFFFPRLVEPDADKEPRACEYCSVSEACVRGDSSLRGRLWNWSATGRATDSTDQAIREAWNLASRKGSGA